MLPGSAKFAWYNRKIETGEAMADRGSNEYFEMQAYFQDVKKYGLASQEQEDELIALAQAGDVEARNKMVEMNLRLVIFISKKFLNRGMSAADLISHGNFGLFRAIRKFSNKYGCRFSTYASRWIAHFMSRAIENESAMIRVPSYVILAKNKIVKHQQKMIAEGITNVSINSAIKDMSENYDIEINNYISQAMAVRSVGSIDEDTENKISNYVDKSNIDIDYIISKLDLLDNIDKRMKIIIKLQFGIGMESGMQLRDIGKIMEPKLSGERVRQLINQGMSILRKIIAKENE